MERENNMWIKREDRQRDRFRERNKRDGWIDKDGERVGWMDSLRERDRGQIDCEKER